MTLAAQSLLSYVAGDDVLVEFAVTDQDGQVANIAGDTIKWAAARTAGGAAVLTTEGGSPTAVATIINGPLGILRVSIDALDTIALDGSYTWDLELTDASGDVNTVARGVITFHAGVV